MDNFQKTPFTQSLTLFAQAKVGDGQQLQTKSMPCTVLKVIGPGIVQINFEVQSGFTLDTPTVPVLKPPYVTYPIQVGDKGVFLSADVLTGGLSGLGQGPANLSPPANLSAGHFIWMGTTDETTSDPEALILNQNVVVSSAALAFFNQAKVAQQQVTGALSAVTDPAAKDVLTSIIAALAEASGYSLVTDGTT